MLTPKEAGVLDALSGLVIGSDDAILWRDLYTIVDAIGEGIPSPELVEGVFRFIERHPLTDLGTPGALVHLAERTFPGSYEELLAASLNRRPTPLSLWMANRVLNSTQISAETRSSLLAQVRRAAARDDVEEQTRSEALGFLAHQSE